MNRVGYDACQSARFHHDTAQTFTNAQFMYERDTDRHGNVKGWSDLTSSERCQWCQLAAIVLKSG